MPSYGAIMTTNVQKYHTINAARHPIIWITNDSIKYSTLRVSRETWAVSIGTTLMARMIKYLNRISIELPVSKWAYAICSHSICGVVQAEKDEEAAYLFLWLRDNMEIMAPDLAKEADAFYNICKTYYENPNHPDTSIVKMVIAFRCLTRAEEATLQYNHVAKMCGELTRAFARNVNTELNNEVSDAFYHFGKCANKPYGGSISRFIEFKEKLNKLATKYGYLVSYLYQDSPSDSE